MKVALSDSFPYKVLRFIVFRAKGIMNCPLLRFPFELKVLLITIDALLFKDVLLFSVYSFGIRLKIGNEKFGRHFFNLTNI